MGDLTRAISLRSAVADGRINLASLHKLMIGALWQKLLLPIAPNPFATTSKYAQIEYKHLATGLTAVRTQLIACRSDTPNALVFWTLQEKQIRRAIDRVQQ